MAPITKHQPGDLDLCAGCAEALIYLAHERTGTVAPITVASYPNGNIEELAGGKYRAYGPEKAQQARAAGQLLKLNHYANCPNPGKRKP